MTIFCTEKKIGRTKVTLGPKRERTKDQMNQFPLPSSTQVSPRSGSGVAKIPEAVKEAKVVMGDGDDSGDSIGHLDGGRDRVENLHPIIAPAELNVDVGTQHREANRGSR